MRLLARSFVFLIALGAALAARADTYQGFVLDGTLQDGGSLNGSIVIDISSGYVRSIDATVSDGMNSFLFTGGPAFQNSTGGPPADSLYAYFYYYFQNTTTDMSLDLVFPDALLLNYDGGSLCATSTPCAGVVGSYFGTPAEVYFTTLVAVPTPEPSTLPMTLAGMSILAVCTAKSHRRERRAAACRV